MVPCILSNMCNFSHLNDEGRKRNDDDYDEDTSCLRIRMIFGFHAATPDDEKH